MNFSDVWEDACRDRGFAFAIATALEDMEDIPFEEWELVEIKYKEAVFYVDVFRDYEDNCYKVYPTFMHRTITDQNPLIIYGEI